MNELLEKSEEYLYFVFRVFVGLLFAQHGAQKLLGWFGGKAMPLISMMGVAGIIELVGGLLLTLGLLTRFTALVTAVEMLAAYFMAHAPNGLAPIMNKGELALLYFASFLVLSAHGAKKWGLDNLWKK
ncbi:DoxX family protein [Candidatus Woesearchaeota archaeon]|nr:DoxX family protein [Candidatus Woesearchaeota archaeon]